MMYSERFSNLPAHVWPRLRALLDGHEGGGTPIHMTIGEPKHAFPAWIVDVIAENAGGFGQYPVNDGMPALLEAIADWVARRYGVTLDPATRVMALNGTREGLYNAMMALCPETRRGKRPVVLLPNPFYQVYMVAALSVGAEPVFLNATRETGHLPDFTTLSPEMLDRVTVAYLCSPSNPQGAVASRRYWADLVALAERHDFRIFADECYAEIYRDTPPVGVLEVTQEMSNAASVALLAPVAVQLAPALNLPATALLITVLFGASQSFLTPVGYQTNLMVFGPGRYRFLDVTRYGSGLTLIMTVLVPALILWRYGQT